MIKKIILYAACIAVQYSVVSCGQTEEPPVQGSKTGFALSFFKEVNRNSGSSDNVVVSPYSAGVALSMLTEGAMGETKVELDNALNGCLFNGQMSDSGDSVVVKSANSIWVDNDFSVRNHYMNLLKKNYDAQAETLSFSDPATVHAINNWCSENTSGKIDEIIEELSPGEVMILVNALYLNAPWEDAFDASLTAKSEFKGISANTEVDMMYRKGTYRYVEYQGCQIIELPYRNSTYSMYVILPPSGIEMDNVIPYVNESIYDEVLSSLSPVEVKLRMPRLKLETEMVLNDVLDDMGVKTAFTSAANFKGISESGPLVLGRVKQKCYIDVTEEGTEAAAVTMASMKLTSARPDHTAKVMIVDRPYLFLIADRENSDILFIAKVVNL